MANTLKQGIVQTDYFKIPNRLVVQYADDVDTDKQVIINYSELSTDDKEIYDSFKAMCETKMT